MIQILIFMLCVYLVFKGVEIHQIALMGNSENRGKGLTIGVLAIVAAIGFAGLFGFLALMQGASIGNIPTR